ncbi:TIGR03862 family flavoprotein, partial [Ameyamaea chiangmaiensis]
GEATLAAAAVVLATGGASWSRLGSDGAWTALLREVPITPFRPANCGFTADWSPLVAERFAGTPLKSVAVSFAGAVARGDVMITRDGIEGGPVYTLSARLRDALSRDGQAGITVDLRPDLSVEAIAGRLSRTRPRESLSNRLRKGLRLAPVGVALLREGPPTPDDQALSRRIKAVPLRLTGTAPLDRAISVAGGVARDACDNHLMLRRFPGVFVAGEMLDWEAPTGGYLLQACLSTGRAAGLGALDWLREGGTPRYPSVP